MSTISNERLEEIAEEDNGSDVLFEYSVLARELLALRKERERAEPAYYLNQIDYGDGEGFELRAYFRELDAMKSKDDFGGVVIPTYTAPPAPEVPAAYEINDDATDYHLGWNACRAAMLKSGNDDIGSWSNHKNTPTDKPKSEMSQKAEQLLRDTTELAETLGAETDTASQQFESLAGKAVVPAGWKLVPVELTEEMRRRIHPFAEATCLNCGRQVVADCEDNVTASWNDMLAVAPDFREISNSSTKHFRENAESSTNGWIPCNERMPVEKDIVLVVDDGYFVCEAQYREGDFFSAARGNNEFFETTCRDVEFWQPLPEPPCK
ncbi:DUF551 domain-containing protein [Cronobacter sakazakii]